MLRTRSRKENNTVGQGGDRGGVSEARRDNLIASSKAVDEVSSLLEAAGLQHENTPPHRLYYTTRIIEDPGYASIEKLEPCKRAEAELVSSKTMSGKHAPTIDIDMPCRLIPSSTEGHFHLYIDKELNDKQYKKLLDVLVEVGIVEEGFAAMFEKKKATFVRMPGKPKLLPGETKRMNRKNNPAASY